MAYYDPFSKKCNFSNKIDDNDAKNYFYTSLKGVNCLSGWSNGVDPEPI